MDKTEVREILKKFTSLQPGYAEWRTRRAQEVAVAHQTDPGDEWAGMLGSVTRTLSGVSAAEAENALSGMESGRIPIPPYGELALTILRDAKTSRQPAGNYYDSSAPTYQCLTCRDSGIANIWNPRFAESYRAIFATITRKKVLVESTGNTGLLAMLQSEGVEIWEYDPPDWITQARRWWRKEGEGPLHHTSLCDCDCPRKIALLSELRAFEQGNRRLPSGSQAGPPACGSVRFNREKMPIKTTEEFDDLEAWYRDHAINQVYEWEG